MTNRNRIQGLCGAGKRAMDLDARYSLGCRGVNPAWPGGMRRVLLREVCREVREGDRDKDSRDAVRNRGRSLQRS